MSNSVGYVWGFIYLCIMVAVLYTVYNYFSSKNRFMKLCTKELSIELCQQIKNR